MKKLWPKVLTKIIWKPTKYEERSTLVFHYSKYTKFKFKTSVTSSWLLFVIYFRGFVRSIKLFMCLQVETLAKNVHNRRKDCTSNIYISLFHSYKTKYKTILYKEIACGHTLSYFSFCPNTPPPPALVPRRKHPFIHYPVRRTRQLPSPPDYEN